MKTDELIDFLARGSVAASRTEHRRFGPALGWGLAGTVLLMALLLGVRGDLLHAAHLPMFWAKLLVPVVGAAAALSIVRRLGVPGRSVGGAPFVLGALLVLAWTGAVVVLFSTPLPARPALLLGHTWKTCTLNIGLLSLPLLASGLWAASAMAPTRPMLAGAAAGLLAGTSAAAVYALHCPEMSAPFLGIWYVLGVALPVLAGAVIGSRLLRW